MQTFEIHTYYPLTLLQILNIILILQWINAHPDGDIHTSVRIGRERPGDSTSINGLFVKEPFAIEKGDIIAQIPWD